MQRRSEFATHRLNDAGMEKAGRIGFLFHELLDELETIAPPNCREMALARTKLEEACFFAKKAMAIQPDNGVPMMEQSA